MPSCRLARDRVKAVPPVLWLTRLRRAKAMAAGAIPLGDDGQMLVPAGSGSGLVAARAAPPIGAVATRRLA